MTEDQVRDIQRIETREAETMKEKLWKAIEKYRQSGGREEHWRNRDALDILLDEVLSSASAENTMTEIADKYAHRMAMVLECIVMSVPSGTAYWDEAMDVLGKYRGEMNAIHEQESPTHMGDPVVMKHLKAKPDRWIRTEYADATMHTLEHPDGGLACIVCIRPTHSDGIVVAGLLVHEAVHIWQRYIALIGEDSPGTEQEAYAIQAIAQDLMESYAIQMGLRK